MSAVLLASGGLDSTTMAYWLQNGSIDFVPLFIDYAQHCAATEYATLQAVLPPGARDKIHKLNLGSIYSGSRSRLILAADLWQDPITADDLYLPYRNLMFMAAGAAFAQAHGHSALYAAFINSNHAKEIDCSAQFFDRLGILLSDYGTVKVEMPFRELSKTEVVRIALELDVPIGITYSCQAAATVPCGSCPNCVDRLAALAAISRTEG